MEIGVAEEMWPRNGCNDAMTAGMVISMPATVFLLTSTLGGVRCGLKNWAFPASITTALDIISLSKGERDERKKERRG